MGPRSDPQMLQREIFAMHGHKVQFILYDRQGDERRVIASCSPYQRQRVLVGCQVTLHSSEAIMLQDAFVSCSCARALVSADIPYVIHLANQHFLDHIGCDGTAVLGHPLNDVLGLSSTNPSSAAAVWATMQRAALDGRVARRNQVQPEVLTCGTEVKNEIICTPVVEVYAHSCIRSSRIEA